MSAFKRLFHDGQWEETASRELEPGFKKIALYAINDRPTHASRMLPNGRWTSKLGKEIDIMHDFHALDGPEYGKIVLVFKKAYSGLTFPPPET